MRMIKTTARRIADVAESYSRAELDQPARALKVLDHGSCALALMETTRGERLSFVIVLKATVAEHNWYVVDETDVEDWERQPDVNLALTVDR